MVFLHDLVKESGSDLRHLWDFSVLVQRIQGCPITGEITQELLHIFLHVEGPRFNPQHCLLSRSIIRSSSWVPLGVAPKTQTYNLFSTNNALCVYVISFPYRSLWSLCSLGFFFPSLPLWFCFHYSQHHKQKTQFGVLGEQYSPSPWMHFVFKHS